MSWVRSHMDPLCIYYCKPTRSELKCKALLSSFLRSEGNIKTIRSSDSPQGGCCRRALLLLLSAMQPHCKSMEKHRSWDQKSFHNHFTLPHRCSWLIRSVGTLSHNSINISSTFCSSSRPTQHLFGTGTPQLEAPQGSTLSFPAPCTNNRATEQRDAGTSAASS